MEQVFNLIQLLSKFSNAKWILSYYGDFGICHLLMEKLSTETFHWWNKNNVAFSNALEHVRKVFMFKENFNSEIGKFLLEHNRFKRYKLDLILEDDRSLEEFIEFISVFIICSHLLKFVRHSYTQGPVLIQFWFLS